MGVARVFRFPTIEVVEAGGFRTVITYQSLRATLIQLLSVLVELVVPLVAQGVTAVQVLSIAEQLPTGELMRAQGGPALRVRAVITLAPVTAVAGLVDILVMGVEAATSILPTEFAALAVPGVVEALEAEAATLTAGAEA